MSTVEIRFNPADVAAWQAQMRRMVADFGMAKKDAARVGGLALLRSIQTSTIISKQRRTVRPSHSARRKRANGGNRIFAMEALNSATGQIKNIMLFYPDLATAKLHPGAKIRRRGLAKQSWGWAMRDLFSKYSAAPYVGPRPNDILRYYVSDTSAESKIEIENRIQYITKALSGGRGPAVATAMARAANAMRTRLDQQVKKATSEAGY